MTLDDKLELFYKTTIEDATSQGCEIVESYKKEQEEKYTKKKKKAFEQAELLLKAEQAEILREKNKALSLKMKEVKSEVLKVKNKYRELLFESVLKELKEYMKTSEYIDLLAEQIKEEKKVAKNEELIVYLNPTDADKKDLLEERTGITLTISEIDFLGGTRAVIRKKNILIDNSFLTNMEQEKENYVIV